VWAIASVGAFTGGVVWILVIFWPYLRWSRRMMLTSLSLAEDTARILKDVQARIEPLIEDGKVILKESRQVLETLRARDLGKVEKILAQLAEHDRLDRFVEAVEKIGDKLEVPAVGRSITKEEMEREIKIAKGLNL
jgi:hypothetical protein